MYVCLPQILTPVGLTKEVRAISSVISAVRCRWCMIFSWPLKLQRGGRDRQTLGYGETDRGRNTQPHINFICSVPWILRKSFLPVDGSEHYKQNLLIYTNVWVFCCTHGEYNCLLHRVCSLFQTFIWAKNGRVSRSYFVVLISHGKVVSKVIRKLRDDKLRKR